MHFIGGEEGANLLFKAEIEENAHPGQEALSKQICSQLLKEIEAKRITEKLNVTVKCKNKKLQRKLKLEIGQNWLLLLLL